MFNKNILFLTAFLSFGILFADNPGEDVSSNDTAQTATENVAASTTEEVVSETSVATSNETSDSDVQELGRVSVTGSRIKRTDIEGATPLITITRADIESQGFQTVYMTQ